jgi:hypothetical protein
MWVMQQSIQAATTMMLKKINGIPEFNVLS